jgi:hypothetical protein
VIARRALEEHGAVADADPPPIGAQRHAVVATDGDGAFAYVIVDSPQELSPTARTS